MFKLVNLESDKQTVSARHLHERLKIVKRFSAWWETNSNGFIEGEDFTSVLSSTVVNNGARKELQDYQVSIDMAKHICLMSKTEEGKKCRQYLIDLEKAWNTPEQVFARALKMADKTIESLKATNIQLLEDNEVMKPKAEYHDTVLNKNGLMPISVIAKDLGMSAMKLNKILNQHGVIYKVGKSWKPYAKYQYLVPDYCDYKSYTETNVEPQLQWTEKGRQFIINLLQNKELI